MTFRMTKQGRTVFAPGGGLGHSLVYVGLIPHGLLIPAPVPGRELLNSGTMPPNKRRDPDTMDRRYSAIPLLRDQTRTIDLRPQKVLILPKSGSAAPLKTPYDLAVGAPI